MNSNKQKWQIVLRRIFKKAATDPIFRKLCLIDPNSALELIGGIKLPKDLTIYFTDDPNNEVFTKDKIILLLPPILKVNFTDTDLIATRNDSSMHIASYENWGGEKINDIADRISYENWGGERVQYENWGGELVKYENWGGEKFTNSEDLGSNSEDYENWGGEKLDYENWGGEKLDYENWGSEKK